MIRLKDRKELTLFVKGSVLDIGCKDCYPWGGELKKNVVGIDLDVWRVGTFIQADARFLPFMDKSFDTVLMLEFFEHVAPSERAGILSEVRRVCRSRAIISVPDNDPRNEEPSPEWRLSHPKFDKRFIVTPKELHDHKPEWTFNKEKLTGLVRQLKPRSFKLFRIENEFYSGYGTVIDLR